MADNTSKYYKRGQFQYWHIKPTGALLINLRDPKKHYDGDAHIFFEPNDSPVLNNEGRIEITKKEFDKAKSIHLKRLSEY